MGEFKFDLVGLLAILGGVASLVTILGGIYKFWQIGIRGLRERLASRLARAYWKVPRRTLIVIPRHGSRMWWHMGAMGQAPAMQVVGDFHFTNISEEPNLIMGTFLIAYYRRRGWIPSSKRTDGGILVRHWGEDIYGQHEILPRATTEGREDWWIAPPVKEVGEPLQGRACFIDRFGNKHWTDILTWHYR